MRQCIGYASGAALAMLAILLPSPGANAQTYPSLSQPAWANLSKDDLDRMNAAAARLYEGKSIGTVERWRNPDTGNAGSVRLEDRFESRGMPCWRLDYVIRVEQTKEHPSHYIINWCKTPAGEWKIV